MSYADTIRAMIDMKERIRIAKEQSVKEQIKKELELRKYGYYGPPTTPGQVPITTPPIQAVAQTEKKAGWGWAFLIVGGGLFVFWGIPLLQGKGSFKPGMSKPLGYTPTRKSPGEEVGE